MSHLKTLSDLDLRRCLSSLAQDLRATECELLLHLNELCARRLFAAAGYSSCFTYCVKELSFSEGRACRWLAAARVIERFPAALTLLRDGKVHATALAMLEKQLTAENHAAVLEKAVGRTKRELENLVAELAPKADVPDSIRKQPGRGGDEKVDAVKSADFGQGGFKFETAARQEEAKVARDEGEGLKNNSGGKAPGRVAPLSAERVLVKFSASREVEAKIRRAQALLSRKIPHGELAAVFEAALDALLSDIDPERKAQRKAEKQEAAENKTTKTKATERKSEMHQTAEHTERPKTAAEPQQRADSERAPAPAVCTSNPSKARSRYIPADVRLAAWQESGGQCTYKSPDGKRCEERRWLEFDHCQPWSLGGPSKLANVRVYCRAHNAYAARQTFGPWHGESQAAPATPL